MADKRTIAPMILLLAGGGILAYFLLRKKDDKEDDQKRDDPPSLPSSDPGWSPKTFETISPFDVHLRVDARGREFSPGTEYYGDDVPSGEYSPGDEYYPATDTETISPFGEQLNVISDRPEYTKVDFSPSAPEWTKGRKDQPEHTKETVSGYGSRFSHPRPKIG